VSGLLTDQLRIMAAAYPDEVGYVDLWSKQDLTFEQWNRRSNQLARWFMAAGVCKGDRVAVHVPPEEALEWLVAYAAVHKAGAVAVPLSTRLVAREVGELLAHAAAVAAVTGRSTAPVLDAARPHLPDLRSIVTTGSATSHGMVTWDAAVTGDDGDVQVPLDGDDIADIMYTSGTTGRPKGVVVRHRSASLLRTAKPEWSGAGWLHASPLFTFAGIASVYNPMKLGMRSLYLPRFDVDAWIDAVESERPTTVFLVPAMAELLIAHSRFEEADLSSIVMCSLGSAPLAPETLKQLQARMPKATVSNAWGMTEAGPAFCFMPPEEAGKRLGSVGRPMPPTEFRIVDDAGQPLPAGDVGELLVRNPGREREYYNDPVATADMWKDGWLHTGDLARLDAEGFLYIVGRKKDVIIRGGHNVHAADVEAVLYEHPAVREAAVAGVPHDVLGEDVAAWVVTTDRASVTVDELLAFCAERLADYKRPRRITFVDQLPRNPTGKVVKAQLPR
jgi:acyl-CoA synthetase (AMP-forming)/AMP-acid ligase II